MQVALTTLLEIGKTLLEEDYAKQVRYGGSSNQLYILALVAADCAQCDLSNKTVSSLHACSCDSVYASNSVLRLLCPRVTYM